MLPKVKPGEFALIVSEKPDQATRVAVALGGIAIDGRALTIRDLENATILNQLKAMRMKSAFSGIDLDGTPYQVAMAQGHLFQLYDVNDYGDKLAWSETNFPFVPARYKRKTSEEKTARVNQIATLMKDPRCAYIVNGMDTDREGESIFWELYEFVAEKAPTVKNKPLYRLWLNDLEEITIRNSASHMEDGKSSRYVSLRDAADARSKIDWVMGINLTVSSTLRLPRTEDKKPYTVGRVQTPTLAMVVAREKDIKGFDKKVDYALEAAFSARAGAYRGVLVDGATTKEVRFSSDVEAKRKLATKKGRDAEVAIIKKTPGNEAPPLPFRLSTLMGEGSVKFGLSADDSLKIVQSLYDRGYVSYPRTDSEYISTAVAGNVPRVLTALSAYYDIPVKPNLARIVNDKKVEAHYAVIPTAQVPTGLSGVEKGVYELIVRRFLASLAAPAKYVQTQVWTNWENDLFYSSDKVYIDPGWKIVLDPGFSVATPGETGDRAEGKKAVRLPVLSEKEPVKVVEAAPVVRETKPPSRYTDKTLLDAMVNAGRFVENKEEKRVLAEHKGIGTSATQANIIAHLVEVGYLSRSAKGVFAPTEKGMRLIDGLPIDTLTSPSLTAQLETKLYQVEMGTLHGEVVLREAEEQVRRISTEIYRLPKPATVPTSSSGVASGDALPCPLCHAPLRYYASKGWGCSQFRATGCSFFLHETVFGKTLTEAQAKELVTKGQTSRVMALKRKDGSTFEAKLKLEEGRVTPLFAKKKTDKSTARSR